MKRLLAALLSLSLLASVLSIPANAASASVGLTTYYRPTNSELWFANSSSQDYDLWAKEIQVKVKRGNTTVWDEGDDELILSPDDGVKYFSLIVGVYGCYDAKEHWVGAVEAPIIKCWIDDELLDDGAKPKASYENYQKATLSPWFVAGSPQPFEHRHECIEGYWYKGPSYSSFVVKTRYSFDTRTMALGKHTLRFAINPEYVSEEMDTGNNEITRTVNIKETSPAAPEAPVLEKASANSVAVQTVPGLEYSIDGGLTWQDSGVFSGLTPETAYEIVSRVKETETALAGQESPALSAVTTSAKQTATAPEAPLVQWRTDVSIVLEAAEGLEYSIDHGTTWQLSPIFAGLTAGTEYAITARYAETDLAYASPESAPITVRTKLSAPAAPAVPRLLGRTDTTISVC